LLVTEQPAAPAPHFTKIAAYRDAAWLIKRQAVSVLPAVSSLKALRAFARKDQAAKPLIGFGDPVFDPAKRAQALAKRARDREAAARGYPEFWEGGGGDHGKVGQSLGALADSGGELKAGAARLGASPGDIHLDKNATETNVKRLPLAAYRVVYFATHGLVAGD